MVSSIENADGSFKLFVPRFVGDRMVRWKLRKYDRHPLAEPPLMPVAGGTARRNNSASLTGCLALARVAAIFPLGGSINPAAGG